MTDNMKQAEAYSKGVEDERERIIALLEERRHDLSACRKDDECHNLKKGIELAISDIKGEQND